MQVFILIWDMLVYCLNGCDTFCWKLQKGFLSMYYIQYNVMLTIRRKGCLTYTDWLYYSVLLQTFCPLSCGFKKSFPGLLFTSMCTSNLNSFRTLDCTMIDISERLLTSWKRTHISERNFITQTWKTSRYCSTLFSNFTLQRLNQIV